MVKMVITESFGDSVERSSRSPRAYSDSEFPAPCRACGGPTWKRDDEGAVHPCCELHGIPCPACVASESLNREQARRRLTKKKRNGKLISEGDVPLPIESQGD